MTLRRLLRVGVVLAAFASCSSLAHADVAPPPRANECNLLPRGTTCFVGDQRGVCDDQPDPRDRHYRVCRIGVTIHLPDASPGDASVTPEPSRASGCSVVNPNPATGVAGWIVLALCALALTRRGGRAA